MSDQPDISPPDISAETIESQLLGGERLFTLEDMTAALNISEDHARRVWSAFGFTMDGDDKLFTADDVQALQLVRGLDEGQPPEFEIAMARALGQTMSRLADWEANNMADRIRSGDSPDLETMLNAVQRVQTLVWRRHLASALQNALATTDGVNRTLAVGFVDIVGYTSLSRKIGMDELDGLLETFETNAYLVITSRGGRVVKTLGDAVMFEVEDPTAAADMALTLQQLSDEHGLPPLRVGIAYGTVLTRLGDVFGEPVNIAARLTSSARPGTVLADTELGTAIDGDDRFFLKSIGSLHVRGYKRLRASVLEANKKA
ncbi:adenylate cyclase [Williamsia limnetica]|uniref:Adenylate cyclase n=1 Tax=Williamsia limnetica TaxID=882452 RepID=A0A318RNY0_WILLI|nr:adenylate/guanylate cyclase domain-containing protein [Williamsia limnetica]PYE18102.1 adenylate cyclase [Williamsia limnetica]